MPKIVVIYPYPTDVEEFEDTYTNGHVPLAMEKIKGMSKFVASRIIATADGSQPAFLPNSGASFSIDERPARDSGLARTPGSRRPRRVYFHRRTTALPHCGRRDDGLLIVRTGQW